MKVLFLSGSHPRHSHVAKQLAKTGLLCGLVIEEREGHVPVPPEGLSPELKDLFNLHFHKRAVSEDNFFGLTEFPDVDKILVQQDELNGPKVIDFIRTLDPDLIISYGVHILSDEIIATCKGEAWNIHGGLSPWYRGNITHFWPSYFLEPQMTGMTVHDLTQQIDAGDVIHQNQAELIKGDGVHDIACRAVIGLSNELPKLLSLFNSKGKLAKHTHKTSGRIWTAKDWRPDHLRPVYELYNDKIVDLVLDGQIKGRSPKLYRQF